MVEHIAQHLRQTSREATVLLYSPTFDPHLDKMAEPLEQIQLHRDSQAIQWTELTPFPTSFSGG
jgi:hypothetical protein